MSVHYQEVMSYKSILQQDSCLLLLLLLLLLPQLLTCIACKATKKRVVSWCKLYVFSWKKRKTLLSGKKKEHNLDFLLPGMAASADVAAAVAAIAMDKSTNVLELSKVFSIIGGIYLS